MNLEALSEWRTHQVAKVKELAGEDLGWATLNMTLPGMMMKSGPQSSCVVAHTHGPTIDDVTDLPKKKKQILPLGGMFITPFSGIALAKAIDFQFLVQIKVLLQLWFYTSV